MTDSMRTAEIVVLAIAETALANEQQFCDLDAVAGDGDFGFSLARGFEVVVADWDTLDRTSVTTFLRSVGVTITSRTGGTSGPIWGTAFLRAAAALNERADGAGDVARALQAAITGISERGKAGIGDKTLLDALVPATEAFCASIDAGHGSAEAISRLSSAAQEGAEHTRTMQARRGRASYTGERSIGAIDPGAAAIALMAAEIAQRLHAEPLAAS